MAQCFPEPGWQPKVAAEDSLDLQWNGSDLSVLSREKWSWLTKLGSHVVATHRPKLPDALRAARLNDRLHLNLGGPRTEVEPCVINKHRQLSCKGEPPDAGEFIDVASGARGVCTIRSDRTLQCWNGAVPGGSFREITMGDAFACAISTEDNATCWRLAETTAGAQHLRMLKSSQTQFSEVAAGAAHVCGLSRDRRIECWVLDEALTIAPPSGTFEHVTSMGNRSCALAASGEVSCWKTKAAERPRSAAVARDRTPRASALWQVCRANLRACFPWLSSSSWLESSDVVDLAWLNGWAWALHRDGRVSATHQESKGFARSRMTAALKHQPVRLAPVGNRYGFSEGSIRDKLCVIDGHGLLRCVRTDWEVPIPWDGRYVDAAANASQICAIRDDRQLVCDPGPDGMGTLPTPSGSFSKIAMSNDRACALDVEGRVTCWSTDYNEAPCRADPTKHSSACSTDRTLQLLPAPTNTFREIAVGLQHTCGILQTGEIECRGDGSFGQLRAPSGQYAFIAAMNHRTCALSRANSVTCWGLSQ